VSRSDSRPRDPDPVARIRARAERTFPGADIPASLGKVRAIIGVPHVPDSEVAAQSALEKLRRGEVPSPKELAALEFVIRLMRQAPLARGGELDPLTTAAAPHIFGDEVVESWERFRARVAPRLYSVGRVDLVSGGPEGTGFLVGPGLLLTNRHVLGAISSGTEVLESGQAVVRFNQEYGAPDPPGSVVEIRGVAAVHPRLDMALLEVGDAMRPPLPLRRTPVSAGAGVATIGYPLRDPLRNPIFADAIFQGRYGVKRAALGEVLALDGSTLYHDCSTLGGNSGSPVFALDDATVAAIHFSGFFMYRNSAITAAEIAAFVTTH
jgi:hypothetical protein